MSGGKKKRVRGVRRSRLMARNDEHILKRCFDGDEEVERMLRSYGVIFQ